MKQQVIKVVMATFLGCVPLFSNDEDYTYKSQSLFAVEGGYSFYNNNVTREFSDLNFGLKVGAQSKNYRLFINANRDNASNGDNIYRGGLSVQHMFNFSSHANFFVGINAGLTSGGDLNTGQEYPTYYGGDIGFNIYGEDNIDYEIAMRSMKTENFDTITAGYFSVIIKYQID